jgi:multiple sugar transport system ATP-binding protein
MARIELDAVSKMFGDFAAVHEFDLDIPDGSFVALLGPSGCGKSTTMNMISGLEVPTHGEIRFDGVPVNDLSAGKRDVGFVFQNYAIFTHMSARANIAYGLTLRKLPKEEIDAKVQQVATLLDIGHLLDRQPKDLSVNDLQKVAIGRSMVVEPAIFLLDEPFSNLDAAFRAYMRAELKDLQRRLGQTMIYVTHDQVEAMSMAEHIAIMDRGRLQQYGSPQEVYSKPANRFVAEFVGSTKMNFLLAEVADGAVRTAASNGRAIPIAGLAVAAGEMTIGIRPEFLTIGDAGEDVTWRGRVDLIEPLGPRTIYHVIIGDQRIRVSAPPNVTVAVGEQVGITVDPNRIHLFDNATGLAVR